MSTDKAPNNKYVYMFFLDILSVDKLSVRHFVCSTFCLSTFLLLTLCLRTVKGYVNCWYPIDKIVFIIWSVRLKFGLNVTPTIDFVTYSFIGNVIKLYNTRFQPRIYRSIILIESQIIIIELQSRKFVMNVRAQPWGYITLHPSPLLSKT